MCVYSAHALAINPATVLHSVGKLPEPDSGSAIDNRFNYNIIYEPVIKAI